MGSSSLRNFRIVANGDAGKAPARGKAANEEQFKLKNKLTALVVDNSRLNRLIHRTLLVSLGVESREVENGKEAVDLCHAGEVFDLILIDMDLPIIDGPQATRMMRAMGVRSKIVGVTARFLDREKRVFMEAGLDEFHEKPLTSANLISLLRELDDR